MNRSPDKIIALIFLLISLLVLCLASGKSFYNEVTPCKKEGWTKFFIRLS